MQTLGAQPVPARRAFTLVEAVATMAVLAILGSISAAVLFRAADGYRQSATQAQVAATLSAAMDRVDRELRQIRQKAGTTPAAADITALSASSITFDGGKVLQLTGGSLTYTPAGGTAALLLPNVTGLTFEAFNDQGAAQSLPLSGAACDAVRRLAVTLTAQSGGMSATLRTRVYLRATMEGAGQ